MDDCVRGRMIPCLAVVHECVVESERPGLRRGYMGGLPCVLQCCEAVQTLEVKIAAASRGGPSHMFLVGVGHVLI